MARTLKCYELYRKLSNKRFVLDVYTMTPTTLDHIGTFMMSELQIFDELSELGGKVCVTVRLEDLRRWPAKLTAIAPPTTSLWPNVGELYTRKQTIARLGGRLCDPVAVGEERIFGAGRIWRTTAL